VQRTRFVFVFQATVAEVEVEVEGVVEKERVIRELPCVPALVTTFVTFWLLAEDANAPEVGTKIRRKAPMTSVVTVTRRSTKGLVVMPIASANHSRKKTLDEGSSTTDKGTNCLVQKANCLVQKEDIGKRLSEGAPQARAGTANDRRRLRRAGEVTRSLSGLLSRVSVLILRRRREGHRGCGAREPRHVAERPHPHRVDEPQRRRGRRRRTGSRSRARAFRREGVAPALIELPRARGR
jgi:hypothetical protein